MTVAPALAAATDADRIQGVATMRDVVWRSAGMGVRNGEPLGRGSLDRSPGARPDRVGPRGGRLRLGTTICDEIRASGGAVANDEACRSPPTPAMFGL